jgi:hypothetical protein
VLCERPAHAERTQKGNAPYPGHCLCLARYNSELPPSLTFRSGRTFSFTTDLAGNSSKQRAVDCLPVECDQDVDWPQKITGIIFP